MKMKLLTWKCSLVLLFVLGWCFSATLCAQKNEADLLLGTYMTAADKGKVVIKKDAHGIYNGTLVWTRTEGMLDTKNPNPAERTKKLAGKQILKGFQYSGKMVWEKGTIYDPESGKTYHCKITRLADGNLKVRGFIGISLLGRTTNWKRVK